MERLTMLLFIIFCSTKKKSTSNLFQSEETLISNRRTIKTFCQQKQQIINLFFLFLLIINKNLCLELLVAALSLLDGYFVFVYS